MNLHDEITLDLASKLTIQPPTGIVRVFFPYSGGEIDLYKQNLEVISNYEIKSHDCERARLKAQDQLIRAKQYWHTLIPNVTVSCYYVFADRTEKTYHVVHFDNGVFDFTNITNFKRRS